MIKGIIFDMDGVIIDSEPDHIKIEQRIFESLKININGEEHNSFIGTTSFFMWNTIRIKYGLKLSTEELVMKDREAYYKFLLSEECNLVPIDGVKDLIYYLSGKGYKLALASSSPIRIIDIVLKKTGLNNYFKSIVTGDSVKRSKPEPDIFLKAAKDLKINREDCIVIEDSCAGVNAAKNAGMKCIGYINPNSGSQDIEKADYKTNSFTQLLNDIENINIL